MIIQAYMSFTAQSFFSQPTPFNGNQLRKTKIVATIGPASETEDQIEAMIKAGMDIARFNTKHNEPAWHVDRIQRVRRVAQRLNVNIPILLDLQGPEIRITVIHGESFEIEKGGLAILTFNQNHPSMTSIFIPEETVHKLEVGNTVLFADGKCEFEVVNKLDTELHIKALDQCVVHTRKTMNTPKVVFEMPSLLPTDIAFLDALKSEEIEMIGLSFVRNVEDIEFLRSELRLREMSSSIVSKIENQRAIDNMKSIIEASEVIMIARGDLGVELPYYEVPRWQKIIIKECLSSQKPVITATQMLLTMVENGRPSRAEVSDVANAVYDGTSAVMLSEETAMGKWPIKAVETQAQIVVYHEQYI